MKMGDRDSKEMCRDVIDHEKIESKKKRGSKNS